jgi:probable HAF family extracellular repeat protein
MVDLGVLNGGTLSYARAINDSGDIVGDSATSGIGNSHAILYKDGVLSDLNSLILQRTTNK